MKNPFNSRAVVPRLAVVLVLAQLYHWFPLFWYSPEIRAQVVNVDGKPVVDAVVVATWNVSGRRNGSTHGQAALFEVSTDKDGWFRIPSWGPVFLLEGRVIEDDPTIFILHPDLAPLRVSNKEVGMTAAWPIINFRYQGQALTLEPWPEEREKRELVLGYVFHQFRSIFSLPPLLAHCSKKYVPRMLATMREVKLKQLGSGGMLDGMDILGIDEFVRPICFVHEPPQ